MELMPQIQDKSVDLILCDLPYGILECKWDKPLPCKELFEQYNRIIKDHGVIVLTATMKFAIDLINANRRYFRYDLVWRKAKSVGFANSHRMPMRSHELVLVFYKKLPTYNPQGLIPIENPKPCTKRKTSAKETAYRESTLCREYVQGFTNYPKSVIEFANMNPDSLHPTQKPVDMFEYFIKTYTNVGGVVLDNCIGSGTTAVACVNTGRQFIGMERDERYFNIACNRVEAARNNNTSDRTLQTRVSF